MAVVVFTYTCTFLIDYIFTFYATNTLHPVANSLSPIGIRIKVQQQAKPIPQRNNATGTKTNNQINALNNAPVIKYAPPKNKLKIPITKINSIIFFLLISFFYYANYHLIEMQKHYVFPILMHSFHLFLFSQSVCTYVVFFQYSSRYLLIKTKKYHFLVPFSMISVYNSCINYYTDGWAN